MSVHWLSGNDPLYQELHRGWRPEVGVLVCKGYLLHLPMVLVLLIKEVAGSLNLGRLLLEMDLEMMELVIRDIQMLGVLRTKILIIFPRM